MQYAVGLFLVVTVILVGAFVLVHQSALFKNFNFFPSLKLIRQTPGPVLSGGVPPEQTPAASPEPSSSLSPSPTSHFEGELPYGFTESMISPYYGKVKFSTVSASSEGSYGEISISASGFGEHETLNITGWRVASKEDSFVVPRAVSRYRPPLSEVSGDIVVGRDHTVRFFTHANIVDVNYRLNRCMGYFQGHMPDTPKDCPEIDRQRFFLLSAQCQDYLSGLGSCELPSSDPPIRFDDAQCFDILRTRNYGDCYDAHARETNFFLNEWRVWLGNFSRSSFDILDPRHDRVFLFDRRGLLVDQYIY